MSHLMEVRLPYQDLRVDVGTVDGGVSCALEFVGRGLWTASVDGRYAGVVRECGTAYQARSPGDEALGGSDSEDWTVALQLLLLAADVEVATFARPVIREG